MKGATRKTCTNCRAAGTHKTWNKCIIQETTNIIAAAIYYIIKLLFLLPQVFCSELPVFMREHHNGMYRTDVYFLSKTLAEVPIFLVIPILFTSIMYYIVGLNPKLIHFLTAILFITLVSLVAVSFGKSINRITT